MIKDKVNVVLKSANKTQVELGSHLNRTKQSINNKFAKDAFFAKDIINICELCGYKLQVVDKAGNVIVTFDNSDIEKGTDDD